MYDTIVLLLLLPRPFLDRDVQGFARSRVWLSRRAGRRGSSPDRAGFGWITAPSRSGRQAEGPAAARAGGDAASPQPPASSRDAARAGGGLATPRPGSRAPRGVPAGSGARVSGTSGSHGRSPRPACLPGSVSPSVHRCGVFAVCDRPSHPSPLP